MFATKIPAKNKSTPSKAVANTIQPKLKVGKANDKYEQEADSVADKVMLMPLISSVNNFSDGSHGIINRFPVSPLQISRIQRQPEEEEEQSQAKLIQRQAEEEEETVQAKPDNQEVVSTNTEANLNSTKGYGSPLPEGVKTQMESGFGVDFSGVRTHTGSAAVQMSRQMGAKAFTFGNDIYFNQGYYNPESYEGRHLLAHELTHTVQQGAIPRTKPTGLNSTQKKIQQWSLWGGIKSVGSAIVGGVKAVGRGIVKLAGAAKDALLGKLKKYANDIPGYPLLTVIIGKDPITGKEVPRNATNFIHGFLSLVPGGNKIFEDLQKSGALQRAFNWLGKEVKKLNLTWTVIKGLFSKAWKSLNASDALNPFGAWKKIKNIFLPPVNRLVNFAKSIGGKIMEFIVEGVVTLAGPLGKKVMGIIRKAGKAIHLIISDPIGFGKNLINAVALGFRQFSANIATHLKNALIGWLFGAMEGAGITLPEKFDFKGIINLVLQILGLTYERFRIKLVKVIGEPAVVKLEKTFEFLKLLLAEGISGIWKKLLEYFDNLIATVLDGVKDWVITKVVTSAITKLVSMFNPAGAIIQALIAIYNTIRFFIERWNQIVSLAQAVFSSISNIASGKIKKAANFVEKTMARALPVIISFLASLVGLGGISKQIKKIIDKIRAPIDKAMDKIIKWVVKKGKALFGKVKGKSNGEGDESAKHKKIADDAAKKLKVIAISQESFGKARSMMEKEAPKIESSALKMLRSPVKMKIIFSPKSKDESDQDIDFRIKIAPNTTEQSYEAVLENGQNFDAFVYTAMRKSVKSGELNWKTLERGLPVFAQKLTGRSDETILRALVNDRVSYVRAGSSKSDRDKNIFIVNSINFFVDRYLARFIYPQRFVSGRKIGYANNDNTQECQFVEKGTHSISEDFVYTTIVKIFGKDADKIKHDQTGAEEYKYNDMSLKKFAIIFSDYPQSIKGDNLKDSTLFLAAMLAEPERHRIAFLSNWLHLTSIELAKKEKGLSDIFRIFSMTRGKTYTAKVREAFKIFRNNIDKLLLKRATEASLSRSNYLNPFKKLVNDFNAGEVVKRDLESIKNHPDLYKKLLNIYKSELNQKEKLENAIKEISKVEANIFSVIEFINS